MEKQQLADEISGTVIEDKGMSQIMSDIATGASVNATYVDNLPEGIHTVNKVRSVFDASHGRNLKQVYFGTDITGLIRSYESPKAFGEGERDSIKSSVSEISDDLHLHPQIAATGVTYHLTRAMLGVRAERLLRSEIGATDSTDKQDRSDKIDMWSGDFGIQVKPHTDRKRPAAYSGDFDVLVCWNQNRGSYVYFAEIGPTTQSEEPAYTKARDYFE